MADAKSGRPEGCLSVCATCPWRKDNHNKPHPAGWYKISNLKRLWNGIRTGNAPGMVCHSTDSANIDYGGDKVIPAGKERECAGAINLVQRELDALSRAPNIKAYRAARKSPMTRGGMLLWANRILSGASPVFDRVDDVALPFEQDLTAGDGVKADAQDTVST